MDIGSGQPYPANALSNFSPHPFWFDGVWCASMEGLLQAFKKPGHLVQVYVCSLVGIKAKRKGGKHWQRTQTLWWKDVAYPRKSDEYQALLTRAFDALYTNEKFRKALRASLGATLKHSHGNKKKPADTCLTTREFVGQLNRLQDRLLTEDAA